MCEFYFCIFNVYISIFYFRLDLIFMLLISLLLYNTCLFVHVLYCRNVVVHFIINIHAQQGKMTAEQQNRPRESQGLPGGYTTVVYPPGSP